MPGVVFYIITIGVLAAYTLMPTAAYAETLVSPSFQMREHSLGNSGLLDSKSENFNVNLSVGDTAVSNLASENFQVDSGSVTTSDPALIFAVNDFDVDLGNFSSSSTSVATSSFTVLNYTSHGYVVYITGSPPSNGEHEITAMDETGPSITGENQFGVNLVANTSPTSLGANPDYGDFGYGTPTENYDTSNEYRFVSGEAIAESMQSGGETTYTISYIVNVEGLTPGGRYSSDITLISVGTF